VLVIFSLYLSPTSPSTDRPYRSFAVDCFADWMRCSSPPTSI